MSYARKTGNIMQEYLKGTNNISINRLVYQKGINDPNEVMNIIFDIINDQLEQFDGTESLDRVINLLKSLSILIENYNTIDRKLLNRKINKLKQKIDTLESERTFLDNKKANKSLGRLMDVADIIESDNQDLENKPYIFIRYLIKKIKNIKYIEYSFKKLDTLVNAKDKNDNTLIFNLIKNYIDSLEEDNIKDYQYYHYLINLVMSQKKFHLKDSEKNKCLSLLYKKLYEISGIKNSKRIEKQGKINELIKKIEGENTNSLNAEDILKKYNISIHFPNNIMNELKLIDYKINDENRPIVEEYIITADTKNSNILDDGRSCRKLENGNYLLGTHGISVLGYLSYNSSIIQEALQREENFRIPNYRNKDFLSSSIVTIFPKEFSNSLSLLPNEYRYGRSYFFEITKDGEIINERFLKTIIKSNKKFSYTDLDEIIKTSEINDIKLQELISNLKQVSIILKRKYNKANKYKTLKNKNLTILDDDVRFLSAQIIANTSILTGERVAKYMRRNNIPCPYRVQKFNEEDVKKIKEMTESLNRTHGGKKFQTISKLFEGLYPNSYYALEGPHQGLGLESFVQVNSELRRASDILLEYCMENGIDKKPTDKVVYNLEKEVQERVNVFNEKQTKIKYLQRELMDARKRY